MKTIQLQADELYLAHKQTIYRQTDRMFAILMGIQWVAGIAAAVFISPRTWIGQTSEVHAHVWAAVFLGGIISLFPITLAIIRPGHTATRYTIAVGQMLMSSLLIHLSGGRIETHFHVFGSLAFLSFYRDWRVLVPATVVVALDHMLRGIFYPQSVFGILTPDNWRWVEHAGWVIFEDIFLVLSCLRAQEEMKRLATDTAKLDASEARYRGVTDSASDAIISMDRAGTILFVNSSTEKIFGYDADELIGREGSFLVPEADRRKYIVLMRRFLSRKHDLPTQVFEMPALHKDGHEFLAETSFASYDQDSQRVFTAVVRDITERKHAEEALKRSQEYINLFKLANDAIVIFDPTTRAILNVNDYACRRYGYSRDEFLGLTLFDISKDPIKGKIHIENLLHGETLESFETVHCHRDGSLIDLLINSSLIEFEGRPAVLSINRDVTERNQAKDALERNLSLIASTFEASADGIVAADLENKILTANEKFFAMWGLKNDFDDLADATPEITGHMMGLLSDPNDLSRLMQRSLVDPDEVSLTTHELNDGRVIERYTQPQKLDGRTVGRVLNYRDITDRKRAEERLIHDALHDGLTGLANRTLFMDHLRLTIERSQSKKSKQFAVLYLDFDRFKVVNDSLGHAEGDKLLQYMARRLETCTRGGDLVARLGGDEFVILLSELDDSSEAVLIAERIQESLKTAFEVSDREIFITTSIGITLSEYGHTTADEMLRDADIAMYFAKSKGRAGYQIFDHEMHAQASAKLQIETEMRSALELVEFRLYYQPIVRLADGELVGFEALIRWDHPERGMISPDEFIPIAEENGMILQLGQWTVAESCRQMREWQRSYPEAEALSVSVNLSCKEFLQNDLDDKVADILASTGLDPRCLKLEITETHIMENSELAVAIIERLGMLGIQMSLDDFGTGYSSLSYLHRLPVTYLKIDRSFVSRMTRSDENREIVSTIIHLAKSLKMKVIAEGIETPEQLAGLVALDCEFGQGYLFAKPLEPSAARRLISESFLPDLPLPPRLPLHANEVRANI